MDLKPCPFCGNAPRVNTLGSDIEILCCVSMLRQKCDYLTLEERGQFDEALGVYRGALERKVFAAVAREWNSRIS